MIAVPVVDVALQAILWGSVASSLFSVVVVLRDVARENDIPDSTVRTVVVDSGIVGVAVSQNGERRIVKDDPTDEVLRAESSC